MTSKTKIVVMSEEELEALIKRTIQETLAGQANFQNRWLTVNEACEYLKISRWTLDNRTRTGQIPSYKFEKLVRYLASDLDEALLQNKTGIRSSKTTRK